MSIFWIFISLFVFAISFNREFKDNDYRFNFSSMHNPEHSLIVFAVALILLTVSILVKKK